MFTTGILFVLPVSPCLITLLLSLHAPSHPILLSLPLPLDALPSLLHRCLCMHLGHTHIVPHTHSPSLYLSFCTAAVQVLPYELGQAIHTKHNASYI